MYSRTTRFRNDLCPCVWAGLWLAVWITPAWSAEPISFDRQIAPLLAGRCLGCHDVEQKKGGLDLSRAAAVREGGDSGPAIEAGKLDTSLIWERVVSDEMPPKKPLTAAEKDLLKRWIESGANWGTDPIDPFQYTSEARAGFDWWSLQPLSPATPPQITAQQDWVRNPVDQFVLEKLQARSWSPSPVADKRTLIRRLSFDLRGLPPTPAEVAEFQANPDPQAYAQLVDRYLASPDYGVRWARHWLDIVRFGESQGFERDKIRTTSWRYRDWVVMALNQDLPYDEFIKRQIAGDVLAPHDPLSVVATGFLVAAPYDEVGQTQQSEAMRRVVRQDELEDIIGTTSQTFLGLTVNCARCHDHKFDPISQVEYYQLSAVLGGVRHGERESLTAVGRGSPPPRRIQLQQRHDELHAEIERLEAPVRERLLAAKTTSPSPAQPPTPLARWEFDGDLRDQIGELHGTAFGAAQVKDGRLVLDGQGGYVTTQPLPKPLAEKTLAAWVQLANLDQQGGGVISLQSLDGVTFDAIVYGEREAGKWVPGSNGFVRTQDLVEAPAEKQADQQLVHLAIVYQADQTIQAYRNGQPYGQPYKSTGLVQFPAETSQIVFGMRHAPAGGNRMLSGQLESAQLYDRALTAAEVAAAAGTFTPTVTQDELIAALDSAQRAQRLLWLQESSALASELRLLKGGSTYAVLPREPEPTHLLARGNPGTPKDLVAPGMLLAAGQWAQEFALPAEAPEAQRRLRLAEWITDPRNPLTPRVMANRLWQYHFGTGLVETPNDFGFNGTRPTHPELLDWLAGYLVEHQWSLKQLHRVIVLSATYQQASRLPEAGSSTAELPPWQGDSENRFYWRKSALRLEAETLRDTVLAVSGALNPTLGGPGFQDFTTFTANSQFYVMTDPVGYEFQRRSLYRMWVRSGRSPLLDVLDCPDPSVTAPKRAVTTTPLQALALLNNSFLLRMSEHCATEITRQSASTPEAQLQAAYRRLFQRSPSPQEQALGTRFIATHGLPAFCRALLNSNEFLYID